MACGLGPALLAVADLGAHAPLLSTYLAPSFALPHECYRPFRNDKEILGLCVGNLYPIPARPWKEALARKKEEIHS
jgi:hypothetical protein